MVFETRSDLFGRSELATNQIADFFTGISPTERSVYSPFPSQSNCLLTANCPKIETKNNRIHYHSDA
jgi:hypothetical protein